VLRYKGCIADLKASLLTCHDLRHPCVVSIGMDATGALTSCMDIGQFVSSVLPPSLQRFTVGAGPVSLSGQLRPVGRLGVRATIDRNPTNLEILLKVERLGVELDLDAVFQFHKAWGKSGAKELELSRKFTLLERAFMIGFVPVVVVVDVQLMAYVEYEVGVKVDAGQLSASLSAFAGIESGDISIRPGRKPVWHTSFAARATPTLINQLKSSVAIQVRAAAPA